MNPGTRLGAYEILGPLGAGGMGEVYRARDGTLNRDVAIKVLLASVADDPDRLARFRREAQVLASLNHPNIAHIHGLEDFPVDRGRPIRALVMELVEGDDLAVLIARGPMPLDDALPIAKQIADALEAAHEQGIIHRDLKPANIKVRPDGTVKVLDFGLAKAMDPAGASSANAMNSPTLSIHATQAGMILGTAAYMSPEQARGKSVDRRADIWAFGAVLFEMLTGTRAFNGDDVTDTIVSVVSKEPDWTALPATASVDVRRLLVRCLKKDPKARMRDIGEARLAIDDGASGAFQTAISDPSVADVALVVPGRRLRERAAWVAALALASISTAAAAWWLKPAPNVVHGVSRFAFHLPEGQAFTRPGRHNVALSPDGTKIADIANRQIYVRHLDRLEAQLLRGTDEDPVELAFSPDSRWLAYFAGSNKDGAPAVTLKKVAVSGGVPANLSATGFPFGMTWRDGTIVFGQNDEGKALVQAVADTGGAIRTLVSLDGEGRIANPQLLEDGKHLLYSLLPAGTDWRVGEVVVHTLDGGARKVILRGAADARLLPTGHLLYVREGTLLAVPFDVSRLVTVGEPVAILDGVRTSGEFGTSGAGQFTVSHTGTLVYAPGTAASFPPRILVWVDRHGREQPIAAPVRSYRYPRLSLDGTRLAVDIPDQESDIWTWDFAREQLMRLTFGRALNVYPLWLPDGRSVLYSEDTGTGFDIFRKAADNTGSAVRLTQNATSKYPNSLSSDGRLLVYREGEARGDFNLFLLALDGSRPPQPLFRTTFNELNAELSPDGHWLAYQSNESGMDEVYVRPFPGVDQSRTQVSTGGGADPVWSRNSRELFYAKGKDPSANAMGQSASAKLVAVPVLTTPPGGTFSFGKPEALFALSSYYVGVNGRAYDVAPDGQRFLLVKPSSPSQQVEGLVVVSHWFDELKARVPIK